MAKAKKVIKKKAAKKATPKAKNTNKKPVRVSKIPTENIEIIEAGQASPREPDFDEVLESSAESTAITTADPVARYMSELRKYKLLTKEEEHKLAIAYREHGDRAAAETLVTSNLRFVVKVAAEYTKFGAKLIDLIQEGNVGLMHAVKEFNPYKGVRLITYAVWWIRGYIQEYLMRQYSMVRIGTTANQRKLFYQLQKERAALEQMGYAEGIAQLSGRLGVSESEVETMQQRLSGRDVSLDQPLSDTNSSTLGDQQTESTDVSLDDQLGLAEELQMLNENIDKLRPELSEKEIYLLEARLLADEPLTLQEIGDKFGVTREAVRQMEARLLLKIKKNLIEDLHSAKS